MAKSATPSVSKVLLTYLNEVYPDRCPTLNDIERQIWMAVGARKVVEHLQSIHNRQTVTEPEATHV